MNTPTAPAALAFQRFETVSTFRAAARNPDLATFLARWRDLTGRTEHSDEHMACVRLIAGLERLRLPLDLAARWAQEIDDLHADLDSCLADVIGDAIALRLYGIFGVHLMWDGETFGDGHVLAADDLAHLNTI